MARARAIRTVTVGTSPTQIRDATAAPVCAATFRYPTGGGSIEVSNNPTFAYGEGTQVDAGADFNDPDTSLLRYMIASTGTVNVRITDWED